MNRPKTLSFKRLKTEMMRNSEFRQEYEKLEPEFQIARQIIAARVRRKMTQEELARRAKTGQAVISRLEGMNAHPSISLLQRVAAALNTRISVTVP